MTRKFGYREIATDLRRLINERRYPPGSNLPKIADLVTEYGVARETVRSALRVLSEEGLIRRGMGKGVTAQVLEPTAVRISLSRYAQVLAPGGQRGPWETACADQGLDGRMVLAAFERVPADPPLAKMLGVDVGEELVYRRRHAMLGESIHHVLTVWYPAALVDGTGLAESAKVVGGAFGLLTAMGHPPAEADELVTARMPTVEEAAEMEAGTGLPLLVVERTVRDSAGRVLEFQRLLGPCDRIELHYDKLPLTRK